MYGAYYLTVMTNDYVAGFRTYYTMLFTVILEGTLSTD